MSQLDTSIDALPEILRAQTRERVEQYLAKAGGDCSVAVRAQLPRVFAMSDFVVRSCLLEPQLLPELDRAGLLQNPDSPDGSRARLRVALEGVGDADALMRVLRRFRRREMLRIAWRDLSGEAVLEETIVDLSRLAEVCIDEALALHYRWLVERYGTPRDAKGRAQHMVVLGMGKLGGEELNFSSDIDLIFAYPSAGETDGARPRANEEFFTSLGRKLIAALDAATPDGQAFRVDMRLRPYGTSGPLAMSFGAMETYYQSQGREWERYALIKARVVAGDRDAGAELLEILRPFVYRRYLDYGALESLREMKAMISREVRRRGMEDNIKLGRGGIREIEFIGQVFQLIRGGRDASLRQRRIVPVLRYLAGSDLLPDYGAHELIEAYEFLRRAENRLQAMDDRQVHELPEGSLQRARLALAMGFDSWERFAEVLERWRRKVHEHFEQVFALPRTERDEQADDSHLADVWSAELDEGDALAILREAGFDDAEGIYQRLMQFMAGANVRALSASGRGRLDRLMPLLIRAAAVSERPDAALRRVVDVIDAIVRRTVYLSLLAEHPMALSQLVQLCAASPWIARFLARHPLLLDELLDPRSLYVPLSRRQLEQDLRGRLKDVDVLDLEQQMEILRQFKQASYLRVAAADISGAMPLMVVSDYLTDVAEVVVSTVLALAYRQMAERYGKPQVQTESDTASPGFAVIAYGKLGGIELGYGSDLDLVFLYDPGEGSTDGERSVDTHVFYARLAQRMLHILTTPTPGGVLFEVDTRLRPSGKAGLLASSLDAFDTYQRDSAWTWEHQALVRARAVAGDPRLIEGFEALRREVLAQPRERESLREEVRSMRERMRLNKGGTDAALFDLKQDRGGIADIEFMVQYGVLSWAPEDPRLLRFTDNIRLLDALSQTGWITADEARLLADAYRAYRSRVHKLTLQEEPARVGQEEFAAMRADVTALWQRLMENGSVAS